MSITIRNIDPETDLERFVEFYNLAYADYPGFKTLTADIARQYVFGSPDFDAMGNFLALEGSRIVGRARADVRAGACSISMGVLPELRHAGIKDLLYDALMQYLASREIDKIWATVLPRFGKMADFYKSKGFREKNRMYEMARDMCLPVEPPELPNSIIINVPDPEKDHDVVRETIKKGFAETVDDMAEMMVQYDNYLKADYFSRDGILAARNSDGDILGVCVAAVHPAMEGKGFIPWLAVLKEHRGKGLGKALLLSGLGWLDTRGVEKAELAVDLDNPSALKLYTGIGFEIVTEMVLYEKTIDGSR